MLYTRQKYTVIKMMYCLFLVYDFTKLLKYFDIISHINPIS